ncbi:Hypothetical protein Minf_0439 [Methylacidiphilum infernorum V4]|uniref:Uncharacterized protein n=1 Tax=Methylacidiphilum infernorum (isolate V4) TaxID=481448 RepID=B3DYX5_METI4|nr:Hypothetical protein Minf_0439 [Methylacidiphilum infernorum V4]
MSKALLFLIVKNSVPMWFFTYKKLGKILQFKKEVDNGISNSPITLFF